MGSPGAPEASESALARDEARTARISSRSIGSVKSAAARFMTNEGRSAPPSAEERE